MQHRRKSIGESFALFILPFILSVLAACLLTTYTIGPNFAGISHILISFACAAPLAIGLFIFANARMKKGLRRTLLPLLVFPILFSILFSYTMFYERNPQHMFRVFVADPIPVGVTNIRAKDVSGGFEMEVIIAFQAPPKAINSIVTAQKLEMAKEQVWQSDFPEGYFPEYSWGPNWVCYKRIVSTESGALDYYIMMWVNPEQSVVIYNTGGG